MKYISMFSGVGGIELGIERATKGKWKCIGYSEIDKYAIQTYKKHFPEHKNYGNAKNIDPEQLPGFDILVGGFPCQSFSVAGKRKGFEDTRGTLFFDICRIVKVKRPPILLLENVKGLLSHDEGQTFTIILKSLEELGYDVEWQVLNSKHFGVPQNRERVFIIGYLRGTGRQQIFPNESTNQEPNQWASSLQHPGHSGGNYKGMNMIADFRNDEGLRIRKDNISPCLANRKHSKTDISTMAPLVIPVLTPDRLEKGQDTHRVLVSKTIRAGGRKSPHGSKQNWDSYEINNKIRRLTPIECERLQSFPDCWTKYGIDDKGKEVIISDSQRYKQMGNAVTVNVIEAIIRKLK